MRPESYSVERILLPPFMGVMLQFCESNLMRMRFFSYGDCMLILK